MECFIFMIKIINRELVEDIYGQWPSFHDAEIHELKLSRSKDKRDACLELVIHTFHSTMETDENGYYKTIHNYLVSLRFENITNLKLEDFNHQNVLWGLDFQEAEINSNLIKVNMETSYGCRGEFLCEEVIVLGVTDYIV